MPYPVIQLVLGVALLILGRRLFWLFVAAAGFLLAYGLAPRLLPGASPTLVLVLALVMGVAGALFAIFVQRLAISVAGFILGGAIALGVAATLNLSASGLPDWVIFLVGGIIGLILLAILFDWAVILLSSITGAILITNNVGLNPTLGMLLFLLLVLAGLVIQGRQLRRR